MKTNWNKLAENKCPKCNTYLGYDKDKNTFGCHICNFVISERKFQDIVDNIVSKRFGDNFDQNDEEETRDQKAERINKTGESGEFDDLFG